MALGGAQPDLPPFPRLLQSLEPGSLILFLGGSVTEQNLYTMYFELYVRSRWQDKRLRFVNVGWAEHRVADALGRLQRDVLARGPALVLAGFGLNDGQYRVADRGLLAHWRRDLEALTSRLRAAGAAVVVMSPTPVDPDMAPPLGRIRYNDSLAQLGAVAAEVAAAQGCYFADVFHPLLRVQDMAKSLQPSFSCIPDGVHPDPVGHLVVAYHLLSALDLVVPAANATVDAGAGQTLHAEGCRMTDLQADAHGCRAVLWADAPPFPLPPEAAGADALVPWQRELGFNHVAVVGLAEGHYGIYAGADRLGGYEAAELRHGVAIGVRDAVRTRWDAALAVARERFADHLFAWRRLDPLVEGSVGQGSPEIMEAYRALGAVQEEALRSLLRPVPLPLEVVPEVELRFERFEVVGPYPLEGRDGYAASFQPERGEEAPWAEAAAHDPETGFLDFVRLFGAVQQAVAYARCQLHVPHEAELRLRLGSDDGWKLLVNGETVAGRDIYRGALPGQDGVAVPLRPGWNTLLFRVNNGAGAWQLYCAGSVTGVHGPAAQEVRIACRI